MKFSLLGAIFIAFGILKLLLVIAVTWLIPPAIEKQVSTIPVVNTIISGDTSLAGRMIDYIVLAFALFTLVHGLAIMDVFPNSIINNIESKSVQYTVYTTLGLLCLIFYSLVLYTNLEIDKDPAHYGNYKLYGFLSGFSFLLAPVFLEGAEFLFPLLDKLSTEKKLIFMTIFTVLGLGGLTGFFYAQEKIKEGLQS
jgi:hypothetical protein